MSENKKKLMPLDTWNEWRRKHRHHFGGNGIACPMCGHQLMDTEQMLLSDPPKIVVTCSKCPFTGARDI